NLVEFEFDDSEVDLSKNEVIDEIKIPELETESKSTPLDEPLPFDQHPVASSDKTKSESVSDIPELGLADINLDIEDSSATDQKEELNPQDKSEQWQEIETKLDLAKAYQEMDDKEGAKEMLEEVIRDGDAKQKKTARKLMKSLS
ncbi:MAG: FimV/HubP family polar landmark protein, partial [Nitrosomonas sp.]